MKFEISPETLHKPVLLREVLDGLSPQAGETVLDLTLGGAGHALALAERIGIQGTYIGLDCDAQAVERARKTLSSLAQPPSLHLHHSNFDQARGLLRTMNLEGVDMVLADLGYSSDQMEDANRGLSFSREGPLDMRLDQSSRETAADIIAQWSERDLATLFWKYGEERYSRRVAKRIIETRKAAPLRTTTQLAELVRSCVPRSGGIDPATRVFQSLRIAVNDELGVLESMLQDLPFLLKPGGRVAIISFHSLEDRQVKHHFKLSEYWKVLTKKPIEASEEEVRTNPRSRSAKLRLAKRI